jgi:uncharacterized protein YqhQ
METNPGPIDSLIEHAERYNKASLELLKLKSIDKSADISSTVFSRALQLIIFVFFVFTLTIAVSFWLGELLGATYYGFLLVASVYGFVAFVLFLCHPLIKRSMANTIITEILN